MEVDYFGSEITREIWSSLENVVLAYVGSAADFSLNPEIDWLFYTMRLPEQPQMRFVETFSYNQKIFFMPKDQVPEFMTRIREIHTKLEQKRTSEENHTKHISNQAFKEVSDMLIEYGIRGYEYLNRKELSMEDKELYYQDMRAFTALMDVTGMPNNFADWSKYREESISKRLQPNEYTEKLYDAYKKDLGWWKYQILIAFQSWFVDPRIREKLKLHHKYYLWLPYVLYPFIHSELTVKILLKLLIKPEVYERLNQMLQINSSQAKPSS